MKLREILSIGIRGVGSRIWELICLPENLISILSIGTLIVISFIALS